MRARALKQELCQPHRKPPLVARHVSRVSASPTFWEVLASQPPESPWGPCPQLPPSPQRRTDPTPQLVHSWEDLGSQPRCSSEQVRGGDGGCQGGTPMAPPRPRGVQAEPAAGRVPAMLPSCPTPPRNLAVGCSAPSHDVARKGWRAVPALPPPRTRNPGLRRGGWWGQWTWPGAPRFLPLADGSPLHRALHRTGTPWVLSRAQPPCRPLWEPCPAQAGVPTPLPCRSPSGVWAPLPGAGGRHPVGLLSACVLRACTLSPCSPGAGILPLGPSSPLPSTPSS